jgi:CRP/FNR family transcriptional regulator, anaerobic regulatory protein
MPVSENICSTWPSTDLTGTRDVAVPPGLFDVICKTGDSLDLRAQQRAPAPPAEKLIVLQKGMLAIDAAPTRSKLQILDFLVPGDIVSASAILPVSGVSLRAITSASLVVINPELVCGIAGADAFHTFMVKQCLRQMSRLHVHQLMIGHLETEQRLASFIVSIALRSAGKGIRELPIDLPMSRADIANYLVLNCDTLSRAMMRFSECGLIERKDRHQLCVVDLEALKRKSPIAALLSEIFARAGQPDEIAVTRSMAKHVSELPPASSILSARSKTIGPLRYQVAARDVPNVA